MFIPFTLTPTSLNVLYNGRMRTISNTHEKFDRAVALVKSMALSGDTVSQANVDELEAILDVRGFIAKLTHGRVQIAENGVRFDGRPVHGYVIDRTLEMLRNGDDISAMAAFIEKLYQNPTIDVRDDMWHWLESGGMPLCPDGDFIAFKKVQEDMTSAHDGRTLHVLNEPLEMPRAYCDSNRDNTCSSGLHFCSYSYLPGFLGDSGVVLILKINPADVVSIPHEYNLSKGRACKYVPIGIIPQDEAEKFFVGTTVFHGLDTATDTDADEDEDEDETEDEADVVVAKPWDYSSVQPVDLDALRRVLDGDFDGLMDAFYWCDGPNGPSHWAEIHEGHKEPTEDDIAWLRGLYDYVWFKKIGGPITYSETLTPVDTTCEEAGALKDALGPTSIVNPLPVDTTPTWVTAMRTDAASSPYESVADVNTGYLDQALHGERAALWLAFKWASSPQGQDYWASRANGTETLTIEDRNWLQGLLEYTHRRATSPQ